MEGVTILYEKYAGNYNNRDFFMLNLKGTQNICRQLFVEWIPQIMYNHHQAGPPGSILAGPPYRDPFNYVFDPLVMTSLDAVGAAMVNRLNVEGKPGYTERSGSSYSTWYNGGPPPPTHFFHNNRPPPQIILGGPPTPTLPRAPPPPPPPTAPSRAALHPLCAAAAHTPTFFPTSWRVSLGKRARAPPRWYVPGAPPPPPRGEAGGGGDRRWSPGGGPFVWKKWLGGGSPPLYQVE